MNAPYDIGIGRCSLIEGDIVYVRLDALIAKRLAPESAWSRSGTSVLRFRRAICSRQRPPEVGAEVYLSSEALDRSVPGEIDVIRGIAQLSNPSPGEVDHNVSYPVRAIQPRILHFLGDYTSHSSYRAARGTLELAQVCGLPAWIVSPLVATFYKRPALAWKRIKPLIRPAYHRAFGVRRIKASERL